MREPFVDTDVIIRLLTGDDLKKQAEASTLFEKVERRLLVLKAPDTVIADAVYVLSSKRLYHLPRSEIQALLTPLVRLPLFKIRNRQTLLRALELYALTNLDFGDTVIVASMERNHSKVLYSYDEGFDRISFVIRKIPSNH